MRLFRSTRALDTRVFALAAGLTGACDGDGYKPAPSEPERERESMELDGRSVLRAELRERPANFPDENVRAALAWVDGRPLDAPETSSPDDLRELRFQQNSDVRVDVSFPLQVRVPVDPVEPMHYAWLTAFGVPSGVHELGSFEDDHMVNSIPHAELVLYHDANRNQKLDLLEPGEPGPGPDRVLAVSSGRDEREQAVRSVIIHKKAPFAPPLELFIDEWGELKDRDGLQLVHISVGKDLPLVQDALLHTHGITMSSTFDKYWARNMAQRDFVYSVEVLDGAAPISLFAVDEARRSWLARGCVPYPTGYLGYAKAPPPGAAVQCGADRLTYASHPDDYCGQTDVLTRLEWQGDPDLSWWPCDENGLVHDTPYIPASAPLGVSPLSLRNGKAYIGVAFYEPPSDFRCRADILYDFDDDPQTHLPALPPPPGSQVMCYGHNALSFVPNDPDCKRKFTYDLSSDDIPGYAQGDGPEKQTWDLREQPPEWWPCDKQGKLIAAKGYKAPAKLPDAGDCPEAPVVAAPGGLYAPPPHSKIKCTSATSLIVMPLWADHCDGRTEITLEGVGQTTPVETAGWEFPVPAGWPCDKDGKLVAASGYETL